ncbi:alkaline phosphatase [Sesbania bispinosa]|nr:alkaline phosphatase [Sesbania bispinosa]
MKLKTEKMKLAAGEDEVATEKKLARRRSSRRREGLFADEELFANGEEGDGEELFAAEREGTNVAV